MHEDFALARQFVRLALVTKPKFDYFPLTEGRVIEYEGEFDQGIEAGTWRKLEILKVTSQGNTTTAECQWTYRKNGGQESVWKTTVSKDDAWMLRGEGFLPIPARKLFPLALVVGAQWRHDRWYYSVDALDYKLYLGEDAGVPLFLENCLQVSWHFDEGSGENIYAPKIGLVKATSNDEQYPFGFVMSNTSIRAAGRP